MPMLRFLRILTKSWSTKSFYRVGFFGSSIKRQRPPVCSLLRAVFALNWVGLDLAPTLINYGGTGRAHLIQPAGLSRHSLRRRRKVMLHRSERSHDFVGHDFVNCIPILKRVVACYPRHARSPFSITISRPPFMGQYPMVGKIRIRFSNAWNPLRSSCLCGQTNRAPLSKRPFPKV
jgi:hypothetical protein